MDAQISHDDEQCVRSRRHTHIEVERDRLRDENRFKGIVHRYEVVVEISTERLWVRALDIDDRSHRTTL